MPGVGVGPWRRRGAGFGWVASGALVDLDFAGNRYFGATPVCARASAGGAFDSASIYASFGPNTLRRTNLGVMNEPVGANAFLNSEAGPSWFGSGGASTSIYDAIVAPNSLFGTLASTVFTWKAATVNEPVALPFMSVVAGETASFTIAIAKSVTAVSPSIGLYHSVDGWGSFGDVVGQVLSGPGSIPGPIRGRTNIDNLMDSIPTVVRLKRLANSNGDVFAYIYNSQSDNTVIGSTTTMGAPIFEKSATPSIYFPCGATQTARLADAISFTIPAGATSALYTFDDQSTQTIAVAPGPYTIPTTLNRAQIKRLTVT